MGAMDGITIDVLIKVLTFLKPSEIHQFASVSKYFYESVTCNELLWKVVCRNGIGKSISNEILKQVFSSSSSNADDNVEHKYTYKHYWQVCRVLEGMQKGTHYKLKRVHVSNNDDPDDDPSYLRMEGHAACSVLDRYIIIVGGWGPAHKNNIHILDGVGLPKRFTKLLVQTINCPTFRYGFTIIKDPNINTRLYMYGGCKAGGYSSDCSEFFSIDIDFYIVGEDGHRQRIDNEKSIENLCFETNQIIVTATYTNLEEKATPIKLTTSASNNSSTVFSFTNATRAALSSENRNLDDKYIPITRGYHSAVTVKIDNHDCMLVYGGLHHRAPTSSIEIYDFHTCLWKNIIPCGKEPAARFGHSCCVVEGDKLVMTGGSDGNDLLRNGQEFRDVNVLTINTSGNSGLIKRIDRDGCGILQIVYETVFEWSIPSTSYSTFPFARVPGRCHSITQISPNSNKFISFGGGARNSNTIVAFDLKHSTSSNQSKMPLVLPLHEVAESYTRGEEELKTNLVVQISAPTIYSVKHTSLPAKRTSSVAVRIGKYLFLHGGWSNSYRELGDLWLVDLAYSTDEERFSSPSQTQQPSALYQSGGGETPIHQNRNQSCGGSSALNLKTPTRIRTNSGASLVSATLYNDTETDTGVYPYYNDEEDDEDDEEDGEGGTVNAQHPLFNLLLGLVSGNSNEPVSSNMNWINQILAQVDSGTQNDDNSNEEDDGDDEDGEDVVYEDDIDVYMNSDNDDDDNDDDDEEDS